MTQVELEAYDNRAADWRATGGKNNFQLSIGKGSALLALVFGLMKQPFVHNRIYRHKALNSA